MLLQAAMVVLVLALVAVAVAVYPRVLAVASMATSNGCAGNPLYAYYLGNIDETTLLYNNVGFSPFGNNIGLIGNNSGFNQGPANTFGTDPGLANHVEPGPPSCAGKLA